MKKFKSLLTVVMVALMSLSFSSCDEDSDIADTLYGTWMGYLLLGFTYGNHYYDATTSEITFIPNGVYSNNGTGYWIDRYSNAPWDYVANHIEWTVNNGTIRVHFVEENTYATIYNYSLNEDYFYGTVESGNSSADFKMVKTSTPSRWNYYWYGDEWYDSWNGGYGWAKSHAMDDELTRSQKESVDSLPYLKRVVNYSCK